MRVLWLFKIKHWPCELTLSRTTVAFKGIVWQSRQKTQQIAFGPQFPYPAFFNHLPIQDKTNKIPGSQKNCRAMSNALPANHGLQLLWSSGLEVRMKDVPLLSQSGDSYKSQPSWLNTDIWTQHCLKVDHCFAVNSILSHSIHKRTHVKADSEEIERQRETQNPIFHSLYKKLSVYKKYKDAIQ